jgi:hypothetical protein
MGLLNGRGEQPVKGTINGISKVNKVKVLAVR